MTTAPIAIKPLGSLVENFDSLRVPVRAPDRTPGPYPYYGASGIVDYVGNYLFDGEYLLIAEDGENLKTRQVPIAFLATGRFWVNNHAHIVRANSQNITKYLLYALRCADIEPFLTGTAMPKLTQANMNRIPVLVHPQRTQEAIASILGALDDKIELNRRMNETLEEMARALFKSWFVDFDPVHAKAAGKKPHGMDDATAALFPDRFQNASFGRIPAGWHVRAIKEECQAVYDGPHATPAPSESGPIFLGIKNLKPLGLDLSEARRLSEEDWPRWTKRVVPRAGDIVFSYEATLGFFALIPPNLRCCLGRRLALVRPLQDHPNGHYLLHCFTAPPFQEYLRTHVSVGATVDRILIADFPKYPILVPDHELLSAFEKQVGPLWQCIHAREAEALNLSALRDTLLPKLLSGELRIPDAEKIVGENI